jgi:hypothetical protein
MPTITIDIPDNVTIPAGWDVQGFVLSKMYESGMIASDLTAPVEEEIDDDPESWFTLEQRKQFKENRRKLEEEARRNPPKMTHEELLQLVLNFPVADEETIKRQDEVREHMRQWKMPW